MEKEIVFASSGPNKPYDLGYSKGYTIKKISDKVFVPSLGKRDGLRVDINLSSYDTTEMAFPLGLHFDETGKERYSLEVAIEFLDDSSESKVSTSLDIQWGNIFGSIRTGKKLGTIEFNGRKFTYFLFHLEPEDYVDSFRGIGTARLFFQWTNSLFVKGEKKVQFNIFNGTVIPGASRADFHAATLNKRVIDYLSDDVFSLLVYEELLAESKKEKTYPIVWSDLSDADIKKKVDDNYTKILLGSKLSVEKQKKKLEKFIRMFVVLGVMTKNDDEIIKYLLSQKLYSAVSVVRWGRDKIINSIKSQFPSKQDMGDYIYTKAQNIHAKALKAWASVHNGLVSTSKRTSKEHTSHKDILEATKDFSDYQQLFGSLDYVAYDENTSLFSANSYLLELIKTIEGKVIPDEVSLGKGQKFLDRRSDVKNIALDKKSVTEKINKIDIVVELLESYTISHAGLLDKEDVEKLLNRNLEFSPIQLTCPLEKINFYLSQSGKNLVEVYESLKIDKEKYNHEYLKMPLPVYGLLKDFRKSKNKAADLRSYLKSKFNVDGNFQRLQGVSQFCANVNFAQEDLETLINQNLNDEEREAGLQSKLSLNDGFSGVQNSQYLHLSNDDDGILSITNLDKFPFKGKLADGSDVNDSILEGLFKLSNYIDWSRYSGVSYSDIDWLYKISKAGTAANGREKLMSSLAHVIRTSKELGKSIPEIISMVGSLKTYGRGNGETSIAPFDVVFNNDPKNATYRPLYDANSLYKDTVITWDLQQDKISEDAWAILSNLKRSPEDLTALAQFIKGTSTNNTLTLDVENLSKLYQYTQMLEWF